MNHRAYFITGTDTGVGKTHVAAALLAALRRRGVRAAGFKPIACGAGGRDDARRYHALMDGEVPLDLVNPVHLRAPLAPSVAARRERRTIDLRRIRSCFHQLAAVYEVVLVEGAGGLLVPIRPGYFVADLARELGLPVIIVARLGLGTINHSLLSVAAARAAGLTLAGLVLNDTRGGRRGLAERTNIATVPRLAAVPLLGVMPFGDPRSAAAAARIAARLVGVRRWKLTAGNLSQRDESGARAPHSKTWRTAGALPLHAIASWSAAPRRRFGRSLGTAPPPPSGP